MEIIESSKASETEGLEGIDHDFRDGRSIGLLCREQITENRAESETKFGDP